MEPQTHFNKEMDKNEINEQINPIIDTFKKRQGDLDIYKTTFISLSITPTTNIHKSKSTKNAFKEQNPLPNISISQCTLHSL